ncbi:hypothetical protein LLS1_23690 [Leifsonia sp. LS1]|uniref:DUF6069 family protein n=1 Tax=Leifsonia sp. LS1 TaxID=2828483 RepID=UPI001CFCCD3A|nr:DUF6069 family protein [Leifsonia sp. LS1]GIT80700.1 hypothetical protein LLS1_23690 [Leifsonia sp. LS1]
MVSTAAPSASRARPARAALILGIATALSIAVNAAIANIAVALGVPASYGPVTLPAYASMTILGILVGWVGWRAISRRAGHPRRALAVAVPVVVALSFAPDVLLAVLRFIPGTTLPAVIALALMHVATAAIAVPAYVLASRREH